LAALSFVVAGYRLSGDHHFAFLQITFDNFRRSAIAQPYLDTARLWLAILAQYPNYACLTFQDRRARRRKVALNSLLSASLSGLTGLARASSGAVCIIRLLLCALSSLTT
jgi:hypothetical protein